MSAQQYESVSKPATDLLKASFPFDQKTLAVRPVTTVKLASSSDSTSVTATFEQEASSAPVSKVEIGTKIRDAEVKATFSSKDNTAGVTVSVNNKLISGSKFVADLKSKNSSPIVGATIDFASPKVALRLKGELPFESKEWDATVALNANLEKLNLGGQVKFEKKALSEAGVTATVSPALGTLNFGALFEAPKTDKSGATNPGGYALTLTSFHRFNEASNGRAATSFKFPVAGAGRVEGKAAVLYNPNADTTLGFYFDHRFDYAASLQVKISERFAFSASVHSALASLVSGSSDGRVVGLGFEVNV